MCRACLQPDANLGALSTPIPRAQPKPGNRNLETETRKLSEWVPGSELARLLGANYAVNFPESGIVTTVLGSEQTADTNFFGTATATLNC